jgi:RNA polymerase sigma factor for flagellar operon FliA
MRETARKLSDEEVQSLWSEYLKSRDRGLKESLIRHYVPVVRYIAERMIERLPNNVQVEDLVSVGVVGLMEAVTRFDPARGVKFESYCSRRIQGAMLDELRSIDWVPRITRQKVNKLEATFGRLESELGRPPTDEEVAASMGLSLRELDRLYGDYNTCTLYSMQKSSIQDENEYGIEALQDRRTPDPFEEATKKDLLDYIQRQLTPRERYIYMLYYQEELTMKEIGEVLKLSESRVSQMHAKLLIKLRTQLRRSYGTGRQAA